MTDKTELPITIELDDWMTDRGTVTIPTYCQYHYVELADGRTVCLFVNRDTNLIVVDVVDADESGGVEILRYNA